MHLDSFKHTKILIRIPSKIQKKIDGTLGKYTASIYLHYRTKRGC